MFQIFIQGPSCGFALPQLFKVIRKNCIIILSKTTVNASMQDFVRFYTSSKSLLSKNKDSKTATMIYSKACTSNRRFQLVYVFFM